MTTTEAPIELSREPDPAGKPQASGAGAQAAPAPDELAGRRLSPEGLLERRRTAETAYVFDVRDVDAFRDGHLPGAYSLPFEHLQSNLHRLPFSGDLIFYDGGEGLAAQAARLLHDNGFTEQYFLEEGYAALKEALERSTEEVHFERLPPEERHQAIEKVLDAKVRDFLARDGGGLEVKSIEDNRVLVEYFGACGGCGSSTAGTLRFIQGALTIALNHEIEVVPAGEGVPD